MNLILKERYLLYSQLKTFGSIKYHTNSRSGSNITQSDIIINQPSLKIENQLKKNSQGF